MDLAQYRRINTIIERDSADAQEAHLQAYPPCRECR